MGPSVAFYGFEENNEGNLTGPWREFQNVLADNGFTKVPINSNATYFVFLNFNSKVYKKYVKEPRNAVLILMEPPSTRPDNFRDDICIMFSRVYVPSPLWLQSSSSQNFNWPIGRARILADDFSNRLARAVAIHSNKISLSTNERYSLRRELIIDRDIPLDTFGEGWDWHLFKRTIEATKAFRTLETQNSNVLIPLSRYLNFKPIVDRSFKGDKVERMRKYLVSIVIENDPSYVSEKIWDAFNAETVPIFIGPSLKYFGIPDGLAIECEANKEAVISQLQGSLRMLEDLHQRYLRIRDFKESHNWSSRENVTVLGNLASSISKWFHS